MGNILSASAELINDKMKFRCTAGNNPQVITDYIPPMGDGEGYMPLELFLASLSACLGGAVALMLLKMQKSIERLSISAEGIRREQHPTSFEKITLHLYVESSNAVKDDIEKSLRMAEPICPILAMIKGNVEVVTEIETEI
jgi:putative redox protein